MNGGTNSENPPPETSTHKEDTEEVTWSYKSHTRQFVFERLKTKTKLGKFQIAIVLLLAGIGRELSRSHVATAFGDNISLATEKAKIKSIDSTLKRMVSLGIIDSHIATHLKHGPKMFVANGLTMALDKAIRKDIADLRFSGFGMGSFDLRNPDQLLADARANLLNAYEYEEIVDEAPDSE